MLKPGAVWALGTMSGTSLDGVDAALLKTDGEAILAFGDTAYRPYAAPERAVLRAGLGHWPGEAGVEEADAAAINNMAAGSAIDGPEWDFVTSVLETLDPDEMQHVLAPTARGVDAAFENLNAQEREKFLELLQTEMTAGLE